MKWNGSWESLWFWFEPKFPLSSRRGRVATYSMVPSVPHTNALERCHRPNLTRQTILHDFAAHWMTPRSRPCNTTAGNRSSIIIRTWHLGFTFMANSIAHLSFGILFVQHQKRSLVMLVKWDIGRRKIDHMLMYGSSKIGVCENSLVASVGENNLQTQIRPKRVEN